MTTALVFPEAASFGLEQVTENAAAVRRSNEGPEGGSTNPAGNRHEGVSNNSPTGPGEGTESKLCPCEDGPRGPPPSVVALASVTDAGLGSLLPSSFLNPPEI